MQDFIAYGNEQMRQSDPASMTREELTDELGKLRPGSKIGEGLTDDDLRYHLTKERENADRYAAEKEGLAKLGMQPMARGKIPGDRLNTDKLMDGLKKIADMHQQEREDIASSISGSTEDLLKKMNAEGATKGAEAVGVSKARSVLDQLKNNLLTKIFSPTSFTKGWQQAGIIRKFSGIKARDIAQASAAMEPFRPIMNAKSDDQKINFIKAMDTQKDPQVEPDVKELATRMQAAFGKVKARLQALPKFAQQQFVQSYFPHMWENPKAAAEFVDNFFMNQGSAASLQKRKVPTIQDGLDHGLKLASKDPIEISMRYLNSMHNFIESQEILHEMKNRGLAIAVEGGKAVGASGNPEGSNIPEGYAPLEGRGKLDEQLYAPEDAARIYNMYISPGFRGETGKLVDIAQRGVNSVTSLELGLSAYHVFTMAKESIISEFARGLSDMVEKDPTKRDFVGGLKTMASSPTAPYRLAKLNGELQKSYLTDYGSPELRKVVDLITQSGGRMVGKRHDPTYGYSAMGSFFTAAKRGELKMQMEEAGKRIATAGEGSANSLTGLAKQGAQAGSEAFKLVGRAMETVTQPLFEKYIPALKNGAFHETLSDWLRKNPTATESEAIDAARKIGDSIDNRFGEMIHDNIFWSKGIKQIAQIGMRSYSWNLGTVREIGGGALSLAKNPLKIQSKLSMSSPDYDPRAAYTVAMPMVVALTSMVYQFLKTGEGPHSATDLMAPRTGGVGTGAAAGAPERAMLPGYEKDVYGWFHSPSSEAYNKIATAPKLVLETMMNKDYRNQPIADMRNPLYKRMGQYLGHVAGSMGPISLKQTFGPIPKGTGIGRIERATAIRQAPSYMEAPDRLNSLMNRKYKRDWDQKQRMDRRDAANQQ
jgi:hypothetical protein